ncbi:hypothetical protein [Bauldia litoralis]|uniref:Secreted protein n=1 Tax=Bauldia litoralis TaxID=665467 RepID=A0A1G6EQK7_9HYPH|nr:hypothetical protein [Bauldia litoralis]SDB59185.1 hypothetical protein SAMN02982931_04773 [Bauldia litoralis]
MKFTLGLTRTLTILAALSIFSPTIAAANNSIYVPPPKRFDHFPKIPVKVIRNVDTSRVCPRRPGMRVVACAVVHRGECWIMITHKPMTQAQMRLTMRHEYARCNGYKS